MEGFMAAKEDEGPWRLGGDQLYRGSAVVHGRRQDRRRLGALPNRISGLERPRWARAEKRFPALFAPCSAHLGCQQSQASPKVCRVPSILRRQQPGISGKLTALSAVQRRGGHKKRSSIRKLTTPCFGIPSPWPECGMKGDQVPAPGSLHSVEVTVARVISTSSCCTASAACGNDCPCTATRTPPPSPLCVF